MIYLNTLTFNSIKFLENNIEENIPLYESGDFNDLDNLNNSKFLKNGEGIDISSLLDLNSDKNKDAENAAKVYNCLKALNPREASLSGIWLQLTHFDCIDYVRNRWPLGSGDKIKHFTRRYTCSNLRRLHSRNGISRLWWAGYLCEEQNKINESISQEKALNHLFSLQDNIQNIIERPRVTSNPDVFAAAIRFLVNNPEINKEDIQSWSVDLNIAVNGIAFKALEKNEIDKILNVENK
tara:strand:- start:816 stop:1529 length:714 start_codon:yes stop_codon:yes gene_type:complete